MKDIYPRPARPSDIRLIDDWIRTTPQNLFDPSILDNPGVEFYCAANSEPLLFLPVQKVFMLESLAVKPGATELEVAKSIGVVIQSALFELEKAGLKEAYFLCRDENVNAYAARHGWTTMMTDKEQGVVLFRWKVGQ